MNKTITDATLSPIVPILFRYCSDIVPILFCQVSHPPFKNPGPATGMIAQSAGHVNKQTVTEPLVYFFRKYNLLPLFFAFFFRSLIKMLVFVRSLIKVFTVFAFAKKWV